MNDETSKNCEDDFKFNLNKENENKKNLNFIQRNNFNTGIFSNKKNCSSITLTHVDRDNKFIYNEKYNQIDNDQDNNKTFNRLNKKNKVISSSNYGAHYNLKK